MRPIKPSWNSSLKTIILHRWFKMAREKVPFQGLPSRICWLGYGERVKAGLKFNELVATGTVSADCIGRDHLDSGLVGSPNRETESMKDGSDAITDRAILNARINAVGGATCVSFIMEAEWAWDIQQARRTSHRGGRDARSGSQIGTEP